MYWRVRDLVFLLTGTPAKRTVAGPVARIQPGAPKRPRKNPFVLDRVYAGIPYTVIDTGAVDALIAGKIVRFRDADSFLASANCEGIGLPLRRSLRGAARPAESF